MLGQLQNLLFCAETKKIVKNSEYMKPVASENTAPLMKTIYDHTDEVKCFRHHRQSKTFFGQNISAAHVQSSKY